MALATSVQRAVKSGEDAEAATHLALAHIAGCRADGSPLWASRQEVYDCEDFDLVLAVSTAAAETIPEAPAAGKSETIPNDNSPTA